MRPMLVLLAPVALTLAGQAAAAEPARPTVVELFTSEGCSSCPPADKLLGELARRPDVLALAFHVTYWDNHSWHDPYSLAQATERQRAYAAQLGLDNIYTPQAVIEGAHDVVGSNRGGIASDLHPGETATTLRVHRATDGVVAEADAGSGTGTLLLVGYDSWHETAVRGGENGGRTLGEANIVRSITPLGAWQGTKLTRNVKAAAGEHLALLLQAADGRVIGAATDAGR